jgi:TolC family type I secretion outer membrane protein
MITPLLLAVQLVAQDTGNLTLAGAVRRALASQPGVASARDSRAAAAASVGEARAPLLPRLSASFGVSEYKIGYLVYPLSGLNPLDPPLFNTTVSQAALQLGYTILDFGGRTSQVRLARAQERKAEAALDAASAALVARVANAYLRVLTTRDILDAQERQLAAVRAEADRIAQLEAQGKAARVDVLRLAAQVSRSRADQVGTRAQLDVAQRDLARLAALPVDTVRPLAPVRLADTTLADRATLIASAEHNSPDVAQAQRAAEAAGAGIGAARASLLPQLQLSAAYMENGHSFTGYRPYWSAGLQLSYPIFVGGSRLYAIRRNEATARAANQQLRAAEQSAEQSVDAALASLTSARATVEALATAVAQSEEVERIRLLSLQVGAGTETDYLDAEAQLLSNRASLVQARNAEIAARVELARVTGDLGSEWIARVLAQ